MSRRFVFGVAIAAMLSRAPLSTPLHAQSCEQELARQGAALRQFEADARREGLNFALDDARRTALDEVSKRLKGDPTAAAAREVKARWEEYQAFVDQGRTFQKVAQDLSQCLRGGKGGCLAEIKQAVQRDVEAGRLAARVNDAVQKWIESLGNEAISRAAERVDRARGVLETFTNRAAGVAGQAATQGIQSCLADFDRRVQQAQNSNATPVDARRRPPTANTPPPKKGMSGGKVAAVIGVPAVVGGGLAVWATGVMNNADGSGGDGGSTSGSSQISLIGTPSISCGRVGGASLQSRCTGQITLDVGNVFSAGTQPCIRTDSSAFFTCAVKSSSSSRITFDIDERIINVDANGNITGCRPTQTGIFVYSGSTSGLAATARVTANIPVTCN